MALARIPAAATDPFTLDALKQHARVDFEDDDASLTIMGRAAAAEIEAHAEVALLRQQILWTIEAAGTSVVLPIAPLAPGAVVTVNGETVEPEAVTPGKHPVLRLPDGLTGQVTIIYEAGFGDEPEDVPGDLQLAIADQAGRLYDLRGSQDGKQGLSVAAARIAARYRRVAA
ncbi:head-tail connector protein [Hansschlegelia zhihuaiae]|jgi:uncharacterized phiE125 gp8 family phage protein|uniref:Phage gp6-like head-tail connector protein n=1 Tax=Hansschlegelia zhihuaiae TaxID=405005 RepID=A0A4V1KJE4_9HYPH|nr:phage head-tail connector protein [Hansschlegelia zhihuaiae]RXF73902.1 hypothetical protein EK403_07970 [Hansschlegelia zhihuaiae]